MIRTEGKDEGSHSAANIDAKETHPQPSVEGGSVQVLIKETRPSPPIEEGSIKVLIRRKPLGGNYRR